ncbi:MAG: hypothetical protein FJX42_03235 [Alphaproteobacteria bacterium]|nr:hypothetical protein [Alphaproteobacteria bacterium]
MAQIPNLRFFAAALCPALFALAALSGCSAVPGFAQVEGVSTVVTEKPLSDHIVSFFSGKNCSVIRREKGQTYCEEDELKTTQAKVYCYKTLGAVNCYDRPDPFDGQSYKTLEETPPPPRPRVR